jgi:predicted lysophospholipase L1 biosynthesis ABC-type transport system permease subunit
LYRQVADALVQDARELFGGDVQMESADPLPPEVVS